LLARGPALPRFITTHSLGEIGHAGRARADAILLSPVFPTRSHPGARTLGALQFRLLAAWSGVPAIALGGMTAHRAKRLKAPFWAAIDGICAEATRPIPKDS
jgi:thiamine-phosphate pyrophosphorylase